MEPLFLDGEALVIDKPAGLAVDRPRDRAPSVEGMADELRFGFHRAPQAVHRLDRDTSGCLLLARNAKAHKRFAGAFEAGLVEKTYIAVLDGIPDEAGGTIYLPLAKVSSAEAGWRIVPDRNGKAATTEWQMIGVREGRALIRFRPRTGRTHQLRVHAASGIGLPIAGDMVYGGGTGRMLLHAAVLIVPRGDKPPIEARAPLPERFGAFRELWPGDAG